MITQNSLIVFECHVRCGRMKHFAKREKDVIKQGATMAVGVLVCTRRVFSIPAAASPQRVEYGS